MKLCFGDAQLSKGAYRSRCMCPIVAIVMILELEGNQIQINQINGIHHSKASGIYTLTLDPFCLSH